MAQEFTNQVCALIASIPQGKVCSYGGIAAMAGNPRGARQVVRILTTMSRSLKLPWFRVVKKDGRIALPPGEGFELQQGLLLSEGIEIGADGRIDMQTYVWNGDMTEPH